jgi:geranylgeranyl pyrophosphate synthase
MTESAEFTQIQNLSTSLASLVASTAPSVTAVQSHRSRSSGFVWRPGLVVTADEALSEASSPSHFPAVTRCRHWRRWSRHWPPRLS